MTSYITGIGTANPSHKYSQSELVEFMSKAHGSLNGRETKLKALYRATGIKYRYSVLQDYGQSSENFVFYPKNDHLEPFPDTAKRMEVYKNEALTLSQSAVENCFRDSGNIKRSNITHLITVSCTGFYAPGLDIDLIHTLDLNSNIHRTAINYMGCYAALSALRNADSIIRADSKAVVLVVCTELCSLHFQKNDTQDNQLANALFGDGAAALLLTGSPSNQHIQLTPIGFYSDLLPNGSNDMAWTIGNLGFEMRLSTYVPDVIKTGVKSLVSTLLKKLETPSTIDQIKYFAIHPGGKKILETVESELGISREDNRYAYYVLNHYGNMSSPTVLFVLNEIKKDLSERDNGAFIFLMAFGPGLTLESAVLKIVAND